jgi:DNA-binding GntR family transcriptional regulator
MNVSPLTAQIALRILGMVDSGEAAPGAQLREEAIAREFGVSRSPVREALHQLVRFKVLERHLHRGCFVASQPVARRLAARKRLAARDDDAVYREIAAQRLDGRLVEAFKEADLGRRFGLSRAGARAVIERMAQEGWIERRSGYGWAFTPILTTASSFDLSYRFRRAIEPAALLEPSFAPDREAFRQCRAEQQALIDSRMKTIDSVELFRYGSKFHEMLARCSGNPLFLDAVKRVNRLRRLLEYRAMVDTRPFVRQAREHVRLLDLIESGQMEAASRSMARHLERNRAVKLGVLRGGMRPAGGVAAADATVHLHF